MLLDAKLVTVRHRSGDSVYHLLPGGGVDYRETLLAALKRELLEETGLEAEIGDPILINDTIDPHGSRHLVNITFAATVTGGTVTQTPQDGRVEAVELVPLSDLHTLDMRPPISDAIASWLESEQGPGARYLGSVFTDGG